jgi:hypothetical protein
MGLRSLALTLLAALWAGVFVPGGDALANPQKRFEITPLVGYQFGGEVDLVDGKATIDSGPMLGAMLGLRVTNNSLAILSYQIQITDVTLRLDDSQDTEKFDINIGYLQIGGELGGKASKNFEYVFGMTIGATHFSPQDDGSTAWNFSGTVYLGGKYLITENFGIRSQIRMLGTVLDSDSSWLCASYQGCLVVVDNVTGTIQGDISAGVFLSF